MSSTASRLGTPRALTPIAFVRRSNRHSSPQRYPNRGRRMKCPKCGYLGFETTDRCRHCGYDFSLAVPLEPASELPLRSANGVDEIFADLDLDRIIGEAESSAADAAVAMAPSTQTAGTYRGSDEAVPPLPLFTRDRSTPDDAPLITTPRPPRPPLSVRRATPEITRRRTPRTVRREAAFGLQLEPAAPASTDADAHTTAPELQTSGSDA